MRLRSLLAVLVLAIAGLGFTGCGSSSNSEFVATGGQQVSPNSGEVVFNFVQAQTAFTVDADTTELQFDFYNGVDAAPIFSTTRDFETTIAIGGVPTDATTVIITGFDVNGFPLFTITQTITVVGGETTTVEAINSPIPVTLTNLRLAPGNLFSLEDELTEVNVIVNQTTQVFLFAEFSDGSIVLVGNQAEYTSTNEAIATVTDLATVRGVSLGTTSLLVQFEGQTLTVPIIVTDGLSQTLSSISVTNSEQPIVVSNGTPVQITVSGTVAGGGNGSVTGSPNLTYVPDNQNFSVDANGNLSVNDQAVDAETTTITVTYTNPDTTTVETTVGATASVTQ